MRDFILFLTVALGPSLSRNCPAVLYSQALQARYPTYGKVTR